MMPRRMKPTTATILIIEKTNSASPYPLTPLMDRSVKMPTDTSFGLGFQSSWNISVKNDGSFQGEQNQMKEVTNKKLIATITTQKITTNAAGLTSFAPGQYETVIEAAVSSRGRVTSQLSA